MKILQYLGVLCLVSSACFHLAYADESNKPKPGQDFVNSLGMKMVWLGTNWMSEKEVTQAQLTKAGIADTSTWKKGESDAPANNVTFIDALKFCQAIGGEAPQGFAYTLPTVAQWKAVKNPAVKDLDGSVSEWCLDAFSAAMVDINRKANIVNGNFSPSSFSGLRCVVGTSHVNASKDFAAGVWPQHMTAKGEKNGQSKDSLVIPGAIGNRLNNGEIGFRVVLTPAAAN